MPGTAAEILDDEIRDILSPKKLKTERWVEIIKAAHGMGLRSFVVRKVPPAEEASAPTRLLYRQNGIF